MFKQLKSFVKALVSTCASVVNGLFGGGAGNNAGQHVTAAQASPQSPSKGKSVEYNSSLTREAPQQEAPKPAAKTFAEERYDFYVSKAVDAGTKEERLANAKLAINAQQNVMRSRTNAGLREIAAEAVSAGHRTRKPEMPSAREKTIEDIKAQMAERGNSRVASLKHELPAVPTHTPVIPGSGRGDRGRGG